MSHGRERHHRNCPHCDEPMEYYPGELEDEPSVYSCPECGWEEEE